MMARDYTPLPFEYLEEMDILSDAEYGRLMRALQRYAMTGEESPLAGSERAYWKRVRNREDRFRESYEETGRMLSERGAKGARARWEKARAGGGMPADGESRPEPPELPQPRTALPGTADACQSMPEDASDGKTETETEAEAETETEAGAERGDGAGPVYGAEDRAGARRGRNARRGVSADVAVTEPAALRAEGREALAEAAERWIAYKSERRQAYRQTGLRTLFRQLRSHADESGDEAVVRLIDTSIANNWQGIFFDRLGRSPGRAAGRAGETANVFLRMREAEL